MSIVSLVISGLFLNVKLQLTLRLNLMFGLWQALLEHTSHSTGKRYWVQLSSGLTDKEKPLNLGES